MFMFCKHSLNTLLDRARTATASAFVCASRAVERHAGLQKPKSLCWHASCISGGYSGQYCGSGEHHNLTTGSPASMRRFAGDLRLDIIVNARGGP